MWTRIRIAAIGAAIVVSFSIAALAEPPADLVELERQVSLELAHVRDAGPTDPGQRQQLYDASQAEEKGEAAIKSGDYKSAEDHLIHAREVLNKIRGSE